MVSMDRLPLKMLMRVSRFASLERVKVYWQKENNTRVVNKFFLSKKDDFSSKKMSFNALKCSSSSRSIRTGLKIFFLNSWVEEEEPSYPGNYLESTR